jgi:hypothetical protein
VNFILEHFDAVDAAEVGPVGDEPRNDSLLPRILGGAHQHRFRSAVELAWKTAVGDVGAAIVGDRRFPETFATGQQRKSAESEPVFPQPLHPLGFDVGRGGRH